MSSQERNQHALQRLMKWIAPRLYENEPPSENSERALRALSGQLGSNPPFVIDAFELTETLSDWIVDVAISGSGKIAILLGSHGDEGSSNIFLTTWPRLRGYSELLNLGAVKDNATVRVFFPKNSNTPAVVVGGVRIEWGDWTLELPWKDEPEVPEDACLTLWEDEQYRQHVAYLNEGKICHEMNVFDWHPATSTQNVRWLGLVEGELAYITSEIPDGQCETLYWKKVKAIMLRGEQIIPESISVVGEGIQFVTRNHNQMFAPGEYQQSERS